MKVRLYVEGGPKGVNANGLRIFRNCFKQHLLKLDPKLKSIDVSPCGSTVETLRDYARAVNESDPRTVVSALVDSDTAVTANSPALHLQSKLDSAKVPATARANVFLMVQCMESWFICDAAALKECFGNQLRINALPASRYSVSFMAPYSLRVPPHIAINGYIGKSETSYQTKIQKRSIDMKTP